MKKNWTYSLPEDVFLRLRNCATVRTDLKPLVDAKWLSYKESGKADSGFTKEDALIEILELVDCNSCYFDLTKEEYGDLCR